MYNVGDFFSEYPSVDVVAYCNTHSLKITPVEGGWVLEDDAYKPTLEDAKADKVIELISANTYAEEHGYVQLSNGVKIDGRRTDLGNIQGLMSMSGKGLVSFPLAFRDYYNQSQSVTLEDLQQMETLIEVRGIELYAHKWSLESQIATATTVEQTQSIGVYLGWPGIDGEAK